MNNLSLSIQTQEVKVWACDKSAIQKAFSDVFLAIDLRVSEIKESIQKCPVLKQIAQDFHYIQYLQKSLYPDLKQLMELLLKKVTDRANLSWQIVVQYLKDDFTGEQYARLFHSLWLDTAYDIKTDRTYLRPIAKTELI